MCPPGDSASLNFLVLLLSGITISACPEEPLYMNVLPGRKSKIVFVFLMVSMPGNPGVLLIVLNSPLLLSSSSTGVYETMLRGLFLYNFFLSYEFIYSDLIII